MLRLQCDPLENLSSRLFCEALNKGLVKGFSYTYHWEPPAPPYNIFTDDLDRLNEYFEAVKTAKRIGCRLNVTTSNSKFSRTAWINNLGNRFVDSGRLVKNIVDVITYQELLRKAD